MAPCRPGIRDDLKLAGAQYSDREVVVDDPFVTGRAPPKLPGFCRELLRLVRAGLTVCA